MRRPGFLNGFQGLTPKASRFSGYNRRRTLGAFGKGFVAPPPPPGAPANAIPVPGALNTTSGQTYMQDPRCPEGEKWESKPVPCAGAECCDDGFAPPNPEACDPEGTPYPEEDCYEDPMYKKLPAAPPGGFTSCDIRKAAGYPEPCNEKTCPTCFAKPVATSAAQAQPKGVDPAEKAKLEAEMMALEAEAMQVDAMPVQASLAPPTAYTGSPMPVGVPSSTSSQPSREQQLQQLVSQYQTEQAMSRATSPEPTPMPTPTPAPAPSPAPPPMMPEDSGGGSLLDLVRGFTSSVHENLFGGYDDYVASGLGEAKHYDHKKLILGAIGIFILVKLLQSNKT